MRTSPFETSLMPLVATAGLIAVASQALAEDAGEPLFEVTAFIAGFSAEAFSGQAEGGPGETQTYPTDGGTHHWIHDHEWTPWISYASVGGEDVGTPVSIAFAMLDTIVEPDSLEIHGDVSVTAGNTWQDLDGYADGTCQITGEFHLQVNQSLVMDYGLCTFTQGPIGNAALHVRKLVGGSFQPLVSNVQIANQGEACIEDTMLLEPGYYQVHFGGYVVNDSETTSLGSASNFDAILDFSPHQPADITGDGIVDGYDLGRLMGSWGTTATGADINGDGTVDGSDLAILLAAWS